MQRIRSRPGLLRERLLDPQSVQVLRQGCLAKSGLKLFSIFRDSLLNDNHPVLQAMLQELRELRCRYADEPCDFNRYQLVRQEARLIQVRPDLLIRP